MRRTVRELELLFAHICQQSYPHEWDENFISFQLMQQLRRLFARRVINFNSWSKIVDWQSFKNRGKQETNYGDIALLVNVQFTSGESLKGVACLEAKREFNSGSFESMGLAQLDGILQNLPYAHLMLYNYVRKPCQLKFPDESVWESHFWVSPLNTANRLLQQVDMNNNWKVMRTAFPFAMFLTARIFWGLDLDFRTEIYDDIVEGNKKYMNPSYVGIVNVYYDHQRPVNVTLSDIWEEI